METPKRVWWRGTLMVAKRWAREASSPIVREKMKEIAQSIEELLEMLE